MSKTELAFVHNSPEAQLCKSLRSSSNFRKSGVWLNVGAGEASLVKAKLILYHLPLELGICEQLPRPLAFPDGFGGWQ